MKTVLILGANGRLGFAAAQAFHHAGWRVLAQARRAPNAALAALAQHIDTPVQATDALAAAARGASVVVHGLNPRYTDRRRDALPLARAGMDLAQRLDATFMLPGNVYNFGAGMPALLSEDTPQRPSTRKGAIRCEIEREMAARPLRSVVLRAGDFFGGGPGNWFDQAVVKSLASGRIVYPGPLDVPHAWAYLPDLAQAFVAVAERASALPAFTTLHFAGHTLTGRELLDAIERVAASIGAVPRGGLRRGTLPWPLLRAGGLLLPMWREIAEMEYLWRVPHALDGGALARCVGPLPATALDDALRATLVAMGFGAQPLRAARAAY
jgi:nucleoside-diphosphate-sugar epimerase